MCLSAWSSHSKHTRDRDITFYKHNRKDKLHQRATAKRWSSVLSAGIGVRLKISMIDTHCRLLCRRQAEGVATRSLIENRGKLLQDNILLGFAFLLPIVSIHGATVNAELLQHKDLREIIVEGRWKEGYQTLHLASIYLPFDCCALQTRHTKV